MFPRIFLSLCLGFLCAIYCHWNKPTLDNSLVDLDWSFHAAQDLIHGQNPYRHEPSAFLIPYPLTSAILVMPFSFLPGNLGLLLVVGLASGTLAFFILTREPYWRILLFLNPCFLLAIKSAQWSPILLLAYYCPALSFLVLGKPNIALPILTRFTFRLRYIIPCLLLVIVSLIFMPTWPIRWFSSLGPYKGFIPMLTWSGPLLALALLRWRDKQSWFFLSLCICPQQRFFYDQLLLWALPQTRTRILVLTLSSWMGYFLISLRYQNLLPAEPYLLLFLYLPTLWMVLFPPAPMKVDLKKEPIP